MNTETGREAFARYAETHLSVPTEFPPAVPDIRFRPGPGGEMTAEWAAYMLNLWWSARDKKLAFSEAAKRATVHFMVGEDE